MCSLLSLPRVERTRSSHPSHTVTPQSHGPNERQVKVKAQADVLMVIAKQEGVKTGREMEKKCTCCECCHRQGQEHMSFTRSSSTVPAVAVKPPCQL